MRPGEQSRMANSTPSKGKSWSSTARQDSFCRPLIVRIFSNVGALIIRVGFGGECYTILIKNPPNPILIIKGPHYTLLIIWNPQNPILIIEAPTVVFEDLSGLALRRRRDLWLGLGLRLFRVEGLFRPSGFWGFRDLGCK